MLGLEPGVASDLLQYPDAFGLGLFNFEVGQPIKDGALLLL